MDFNKLTIKAQEAVAAAQELARRNGNPELYPEHLLLALLDQELPRELVTPAGEIRVKGFDAPVLVFEVAGVLEEVRS